MTDHVARPNGAASSQRVAALHALCRQDFAKGEAERANASAPTDSVPALTAQYNELDVAIRVAQQLLDSGSTLSLREALRRLLRALDAEPVDADEDARRFVDHHFPTVAAFLDDSDQPSHADETLRRARQNGGSQ